jgi:hypothetical protein
MASRLTGKRQNDFILKFINYFALNHFAYEFNKLFFLSDPNEVSGKVLN